jgi:hypothetical protein
MKCYSLSCGVRNFPNPRVEPLCIENCLCFHSEFCNFADQDLQILCVVLQWEPRGTAHTRNKSIDDWQLVHDELKCVRQESRFLGPE